MTRTFRATCRLFLGCFAVVACCGCIFDGGMNVAAHDTHQSFATFAGFPDATDTSSANCYGICASGEVCNPATNACERKNCAAGCLAGWECDTASNTCGIPCGVPCLGNTACNHANLQCESVCGAACPDKYCDVVGKTCKAPCLPVCGTDALCQKHAIGLGTCKAVKLATSWSPETNVALSFKVLPKNQGCDLDGDGVPNNGSANISVLWGAALGASAVAFVPEAFASDGSAFGLAAYDVALAGGPTSTCVPADTSCPFVIDKQSLDAAACDLTGCPALAQTSQATVSQGALKADFATVPLGGLLLHDAHVTGLVTGGPHWTATINGQICGRIVYQELLDAVVAFGGFTKSQIQQMLPTLIKPDLDSDGDGVKESVSAAFAFETVPGQIVGYSTE
jgi:hypothetical protein